MRKTTSLWQLISFSLKKEPAFPWSYNHISLVKNAEAPSHLISMSEVPESYLEETLRERCSG